MLKQSLFDYPSVTYGDNSPDKGSRTPDFVDTLNHRFKTVIFFLVLIRSFKPHKTNIECFIETILGGFLYNPLIIGQLNIAIH